MKRRLLLACAALIFGLALLILVTHNPEKTFDLEGVTKITVMSGNTGKIVGVTDKAVIQQIADNIGSITFKRGTQNNSDGWSYNLRWYDADGQEIENITIKSKDGSKLTYNRYNWSAVSGGIDTGLLDDILEK